uniref:Uncharacterized protein n=1 Tax=Glossina austeni TaxID=7395 RepID=A0A1A9UEQ3_GLOAU
MHRVIRRVLAITQASPKEMVSFSLAEKSPYSSKLIRNLETTDYADINLPELVESDRQHLNKYELKIKILDKNDWITCLLRIVILIDIENFSTIFPLMVSYIYTEK